MTGFVFLDAVLNSSSGCLEENAPSQLECTQVSLSISQRIVSHITRKHIETEPIFGNLLFYSVVSFEPCRSPIWKSQIFR